MVFLSEHLPHDRPHTVEDVDAIAPAMLAQARPLVITPLTPLGAARHLVITPVALPAQARLLVITPVTPMPTGASPSLLLPPTATATATATANPTPDQVEADAYWCLSKLLDSIQDHYTQP